MSLRKSWEILNEDITPKATYFNRRQMLKAMGLGGVALIGWNDFLTAGISSRKVHAGTKLNVTVKSPFSTTEKESTFQDVTHYNNFYEFGTDKTDPAKYAVNFRTSPWTVSIEGEVRKADQIEHGRHAQGGSARRAHLPASLCRTLVDRGALDRVFIQPAGETGRAHRKSQVCGVYFVL